MSAAAGSVKRGDDGVRRCWWCVGDRLYERYHDSEWGRPMLDDRHVFEHFCLEGFQAGLSWITILRRREHFRTAFKGFDPEKVARFNTRSVQRLLRNERIIRHRGKIESAINNARRALDLIDEFGSLAAYVWLYEPKPNRRGVSRETIPVMTPGSTSMSKDLKKRGWSFVGPTGLYALMQSVGVVNDHVSGCAYRSKVEATRQSLVRPAIR